MAPVVSAGSILPAGANLMWYLLGVLEQLFTCSSNIWSAPPMKGPFGSLASFSSSWLYYFFNH